LPEPNVTYSAVLLLSAILMTFMAMYCLRRRQVPGAIAFAFLLMAEIAHSFGYAMEVISPSLDGMLFWNHIQYLGIPFVPALWLLLAIQYTGKGYLLSPWAGLYLFTIPVLTLLFRFTDPYLHLHYAGVSIHYADGFPVLSVQGGPWYLVNAVYTNVAAVLASVLYLKLLLQTQGQHQRQVGAMLVASLFPWAAILIYWSGSAPYGLDLVPLGVVLSNAVFLVSMFRYGLVDLIPLARERVFEWMVDGVVVLDDEHRIVDFNPSAARMLPELGRFSIGRECSRVFETRDRLVAAISGESDADIEAEADGSPRHYNVRTVELFGRSQETIGYMVFLSDITERVEAMQQLEVKASVDDLTGVFNRQHFFDRCQYEFDRAARQGEPLAFVILDIDFFKDINDQYGHQMGDTVLRGVAEACRGSIRSIDLLGRYGGEEFVFLLPKTGIREALVVAERLRGAIEMVEVRSDVHRIRVTASFGVATAVPREGDTLYELIRRADQGLYRAKAEGRNRVRIVEEDSPWPEAATATDGSALEAAVPPVFGVQQQHRDR